MPLPPLLCFKPYQELRRFARVAKLFNSLFDHCLALWVLTPNGNVQGAVHIAVRVQKLEARAVTAVGKQPFQDLHRTIA